LHASQRQPAPMGGPGSGRKRNKPDEAATSGVLSSLWTLAPAAAPDEADEPAESITVAVAVAVGNAVQHHVIAGPPEEASQGAQHVTEPAADSDVRAKLQHHFNIPSFPYSSVF
jgi:hypothetical protein